VPARELLDVLVVGGGPAGTATALSALRENPALRVGVVEKTCYESSRVGESLSPGATGLLQQLGALTRFELAGHLPAFGNSAAWGSDAVLDRDFLFTPFGYGWRLNRRRFDADLAADACDAGVRLWTSTSVESLEREAGAWRIGVRQQGTTSMLQARFLVDASGRSQTLARRLGARRRLLDSLVALVAHFPAEQDGHRFTLVEACDEGWIYSSYVPGDGADQPPGWWVALMCDADRMRTENLRRPSQWWNRLQDCPHTRDRLCGFGPPSAIRAVAAQSVLLEPMLGDGWLAVGDAAASYDPLSSSGIVRALDSGMRAGRAVARACRTAESPSESIEGEFRELALAQQVASQQYLGTWARYYQMEQRWPDSPFWRRRQRLVTLDPASVLQARRVAHSDQAPRWPSDLAPLEQLGLLQLCSNPSRACDIVMQHPLRERLGDLDIIFGLQWLLQTGDLAAMI